MGFTVGWDEPLGRGFPQSAQTLPLPHLSDVAGSASAVERPPFLREVPPLGLEGSKELADGARLPPNPIDKLAPGVDSLVGCGVNEEEVGEGVVLLVSVDVVDLVALGDWPVSGFPSEDVAELEPLSSAGGASEVALSGDEESVSSLGLGAGLSHAPSLSHSPLSR
jgi:hypothetical protein